MFAYRSLHAVMRRVPSIRRWWNHTFYQFIASLDKHGELTLMNYGYRGDTPITLDEVDEPDRLNLQLYHHVASEVDLTGKDVLEIGSGRGGGASYMMRYLKPNSLIGVDFSEKAVTFCQQEHIVEGLSYQHGDAENLPFEAERFDVVVNVESSHCYGSMERFLSEVARVLKPGGHLLWADLRRPEQLDGLYVAIKAAGLKAVTEETITDNVSAALDGLHERNRALINKRVPTYLHWLFRNFAANQGSENYNRFQDGGLLYLRMVLTKAS